MPNTPDEYDDIISTALAPKPRGARPPRAANYDEIINRHAARNNLDPNLVRAVIGQESGGNPRARSPKNAQGLMQLMPATAARFGVKNIHDPEENIRGGTDYLKFLNKRFKGNTDLVLAGYNAGEGAVEKYGNKIPPYRETQAYVPAVKARYQKLGGQVQTPKVDPYDDIADTVLGQKAKAPAVNDYDDIVEKALGQPRPVKPARPSRSAYTRTRPIRQPVETIDAGPGMSQSTGLLNNDPFALVKDINAQPFPVDPEQQVYRAQKEAVRQQVRQERNPQTLMGKLGRGVETATQLSNMVMGKVPDVLRPEDQVVEEQANQRLAAQARANTPEMIAERTARGEMSAPRRMIDDPVTRLGASSAKLLGGISSLAGVAPNRLSEYFNKTGNLWQEGTELPPLTPKGEEVVRGLPEKAGAMLGDIGLTVAQLAYMKKTSGLSMAKIMGIETALKTSDLPVAERAPKVAEAMAMGRILDGHLGRVGSAALFGAPTAVQTGTEVLKGNMRPAEALMSTGIQAGVGGLMGGKPKGAERVPRIAEEQLPRTEVANRPTDVLPSPSQPVAETEANPTAGIQAGRIGSAEQAVREASKPVEAATAPATKGAISAETPVDLAAGFVPEHHSASQNRRARNTKHGGKGQFKPGKVELAPSESVGDRRSRLATPEEKALGESMVAQHGERRTAEAGERRASRDAEVDELTGVANQKALIKATPNMEADPNTTILSLDVRNLKAANTILGRDAGSEAIKDAAAAMKQAAEEHGVSRVFRDSGDEIIAGVPNEKAEAIRTRAKEIFQSRTAGEYEVRIDIGKGQTRAEADADLKTRKSGKSFRPIEVPSEVGTPVVEYKKVEPIKAEISDKPFEWKTSDGQKMKAEAGDWKVTQPDGSISSVKPSIFKKTYEPAEGKPGEFLKTATTNAQQLEGPIDIETLEGKGHGEKGDYLVTGAEGERYIVKRDKFESMYREHKPEGGQSRPPESSTAANRAKVTEDRTGRGETAIPNPERKSDEVLLESAKAANAKDPTEPMRLVDQVLNGSKSLTDTEVVQVDLHRQELKNKYDAVNKELDATTDPAKIQELTDRSDAMEREIRASEEAHATSNTATARALRAARVTVDQDFRLLTMVSRAIKARGRQLSPEERATVKEQAVKIAKLETELAAANDRAAQAEAQRAVEKIKRETIRDTRRAARGAKKENLDDEAAQLKQLITQAWKKQAGSGGSVQPMGLAAIDPEGVVTKLVLQLARNRVKKGIVNAEGLVNEIHSLVKDVIDDKRVIRDMISGYGRPKGARSELQKQIDTLKSELFKISSEEDIEAGSRAPRSEGPRTREAQHLPMEGPRKSEARQSGVPLQGPKLSDANKLPAQGPKITDAPFVGPRQSDVRRVRMEGPRITDAPKLGPRDTAPALRKRIQGQIVALEKRIATGDYSKNPPREPTVYDRHTLALQKQLESVKRDYENANYRATRSTWGRIKDEVGKFGNLPKTMKSMADISAVFRQGGFYSITHPITGLAKPSVAMFRSFTEAGFRNVESAIKGDKNFDLAKRSGVEFTGVDKNDPHLSHREEGYFGTEAIDTLAKGKFNPLRIVRGTAHFSERTFVSFLDSQRMNVFNKMVDALKPEHRTPKAMKEIATLINQGTGRGNLGVKGNQAAPLLNIVMFSPRLVASRVQLLNNMFNPVAMARKSPGVRKQMIADNVKFLAATTAVMGLATAMGGTVNTNPDDGDFLKIRFGKTTYDILTGLQQPFRYIVNMNRAALGGKGYTGKSMKQMTSPFEPGSFTRSKTSPLAGVGITALTGRDYVGKPFSPKKEAGDLVMPLPITDFAEAMQKEGLIKGFAKALPSVTGIGVQTYDKPKPRRGSSRPSMFDEARKRALRALGVQ